MAAVAAIAAALIGAGATAYSSDQQNSNSLIGAAGQKPKPTGGGDFKSVAASFAPGVSGTGDGSMPVGQNKSENISPFADTSSSFTQKPEYTPPPVQIAPEQTGTMTAPNAVPDTSSSAKADSTTSNYAQLAQAGIGLGQALMGSSPQPMPPAQVGGQGYQPTAMALLQQLSQRKRVLGY